MLSAYPACFFKEDNGYSVIFPDLNDLATCGSTIDEAFAMAVDCLAGYIYTLKKDGEDIPAPSPMSAIHPDDVIKDLDVTCSESFVNMVTVDVAEYAKKHFEKSVKKTLSIPSWLNDMALQNNINFSKVLQDALKAQLHVS